MILCGRIGERDMPEPTLALQWRLWHYHGRLDTTRELREQCPGGSGGLGRGEAFEQQVVEAGEMLPAGLLQDLLQLLSTLRPLRLDVLQDLGEGKDRAQH
jgi:hypothetical protein